LAHLVESSPIVRTQPIWIAGISGHAPNMQDALLKLVWWQLTPRRKEFSQHFNCHASGLATNVLQLQRAPWRANEHGITHRKISF
jgi:hypothetical protein